MRLVRCGLTMNWAIGCRKWPAAPNGRCTFVLKGTAVAHTVYPFPFLSRRKAAIPLRRVGTTL